MTNADKPRLAGALAMLGETFNESVSTLRAEGYFLGLGDLDIAAVETAARLAISHCKFFPKPIELRELVSGGSLVDGAMLAWADMIREVRRIGYIGTPHLPEATMEAIRSLWGSWQSMCESLPSDGPELLGWMKRFEQLYGAQHNQRRALNGAPAYKRLDEMDH